MNRQKEAPALREQRTGRGCLAGSAGTPETTQLAPNRQTEAWTIVLPSGEARTVAPKGRPAWLLSHLVDAGARGLSARDLPAGLRVSGYVHTLRRLGVPIATAHKAHGGPFSGHHAVYRLDCEAEPLGGT
jgi:hypothetical protein